jgi:hypothetical protein
MPRYRVDLDADGNIVYIPVDDATVGSDCDIIYEPNEERREVDRELQE